LLNILKSLGNTVPEISQGN